jgi:hypothetical protein
MVSVPDEQDDKVASPATQACAAKENSLRMTTAQYLEKADPQPCGTWSSGQINLKNDLRHAPVSVQLSFSIEPDNNDLRGGKKYSALWDGPVPICCSP